MADNFTVVTNELEQIATPTEEVAPQEEVKGEVETPITDETPSSEETEKEVEPKAETQNHSRYQKRIDKLVKQREDAERERARLEDELNFYKSKESTKPYEDEKEISPLDFDTYEEYEEALNKANTKSQSKKEEAPKETDRTFESAARKLEDVFDDAREKYTDFDNVIKNPNIPITKDMVIALSELENAGEVAYFLATNEETAKEISQLSPYKQAIELAKIESKLNAKPNKKVSNAPDPIDPVKPNGDVSKTDPSKMSFAEYEQYMNKQENKKSKFW